jgi:tetratricopeptide (TPR) repeat protein
LSLIKILFLFLFSFSALALTEEEEKKYDELEGLAFLEALIKDKKYQEVIKQYPAISKDQRKMALYHYTLANAHFHLKEFKKSYEILERGNQAKGKNPDYNKLWARTSSELKKFKDCSSLFSKVPKSSISGSDWKIFGNCLVENGEEDKLVNLVLNHKTHDFDFLLLNQKILSRNGLHSFAKEKRAKFLSSCLEVDDYLSLWTVLESEKVTDIKVLEIGHACHPHAIELTSLLVKNLFNEGKYHSIAYVFETLSVEDLSYLKHAAEFYKVAGRNTVADYFFILGDEDGYLLARSANFLNQENYAGLMTIPFKSSFLRSNKDLIYAVAYSQFKYLNLDTSLSTLTVQTKKSSRDLQLEGLIDQCKSLGWKCRP